RHQPSWWCISWWLLEYLRAARCCCTGARMCWYESRRRTHSVLEPKIENSVRAGSRASPPIIEGALQDRGEIKDPDERCGAADEPSEQALRRRRRQRDYKNIVESARPVAEAACNGHD